jgi:hypothetical protein
MEIDMKPTDNYAVSARRLSPTGEHDDFPTPPWATRALIEHVIGKDWVQFRVCWEPAANRGYMSRALQEYFEYVLESDVVDYGRGGVFDFLSAETTVSDPAVNWIITNPPFNKAQQFIEKAQSIATEGVAMLVRTSFLEGIMRYQTMFMHNPPDIVAQFSERVPMVKGRYDPKASTATSYAWLVWYAGPKEANKKTILMWIPPCKRELMREGDDV